MMKIILACLVALAGTALTAVPQNDTRDKDGNYLLLVRPVNVAGWHAQGVLPPPVVSCTIDRRAWKDVSRLFIDAGEVLRHAGERESAYRKFLDAMGREEVPMSRAAVRTEIVLDENEYYFDRYGRLFVDGRFVLPREVGTILRVEKFYRDIYARDHLSLVIGAQLVDREEEIRQAKVQVFRGFEDDRYQEHDDLILRLVDDFNHNRGLWAGATVRQAARIHDLPPDLVKAHMIEETGGGDRGSRAAWCVDPQQVNVPGDWNRHKAALGLVRPRRRNEGNAETNVVAAIRYLSRKGFGVSGQPAANRPSGSFDGWYMALQRYNGRNDEAADGRAYKEAYAERVVQRANDPDAFVPISILTKKAAARRSAAQEGE